MRDGRHLDPAVGGRARGGDVFRAGAVAILPHPAAGCHLRLLQLDDVHRGQRDHRVAGQCVGLGEVPRPLRRVRDVVHVLHVALVPAGHRDVARVRRPGQRGRARPRPLPLLVGPRLVVAVGVVPLAIGGQPDRVPAPRRTHVQVVLVREGLPAPVGGLHEGQPRGERVPHRAGVARDVAGEAPIVRGELDFALAPAEAECAERQLVRDVAGVVRERHRPGQAVVVEEGFAAARGRVHHHELVARPRVVAVPEAVAVPGFHPVRDHLGARNHALGVPGQKALGARVVHLLSGRRPAPREGCEENRHGERTSGGSMGRVTHGASSCVQGDLGMIAEPARGGDNPWCQCADVPERPANRP